jgi:hypothetical protein
MLQNIVPFIVGVMQLWDVHNVKTGNKFMEMTITIPEAKSIAKELRELAEKLEKKHKIHICLHSFTVDHLKFTDGSEARGYRD